MACDPDVPTGSPVRYSNIAAATISTPSQTVLDVRTFPHSIFIEAPLQASNFFPLSQIFHQFGVQCTRAYLRPGLH